MFGYVHPFVFEKENIFVGLGRPGRRSLNHFKWYQASSMEPTFLSRRSAHTFSYDKTLLMRQRPLTEIPSCIKAIEYFEGGLEEFETVMQTLKYVSALHNFREFFLAVECLDEAM